MPQSPHTASSAHLTAQQMAHLVQNLLQQGLAVDINAQGMSMYPTLRPGDVLHIQRPNADALPPVGSVVTFIDTQGRVVAHRLVGQDDAGNLITRGDGCLCPDPPLAPHNLLGVVTQAKRKDKPIACTPQTWTRSWTYKSAPISYKVNYFIAHLLNRLHLL
ncbi:MAG: S24/S26 family peptidase [Marinilabiliaceae bacterium]|nr:S24/S26 family peptidase [Bacteroidales bacterium]MDD5816806.1 S24/S26 family peptidase [Bacteroidales bacterium]MDY4519997.1 S24/S26 family peptidase [Bacteroidales bacterium]